VIDRHDWNLILMLNLRRFGCRSEPTKLETPCFWWPVSGTRNFLRRTWVVCHPPNGVIRPWSSLFTVSPQQWGTVFDN